MNNYAIINLGGVYELDLEKTWGSHVVLGLAWNLSIVILCICLCGLMHYSAQNQYNVAFCYLDKVWSKPRVMYRASFILGLECAGFKLVLHVEQLE